MKIFLLMGQSNMVGRGPLAEVGRLSDPNILAFSKDDWQTAEEPLHDNREGLGIGLAMTFALELIKNYELLRIGLVPCAQGGSRLERWEEGADLYSLALQKARAAQSAGAIGGILWHQGESDSRQAEDANTYFDRFSAMIYALRRDLGGTAPIPVIVGELGRFLFGRQSETPFVFCQVVNDALKRTAETLPATGFVSSEGLEDKGDLIHFNSTSLREFGRRYGRAYLEVVEREGIDLVARSDSRI